MRRSVVVTRWVKLSLVLALVISWTPAQSWADSDPEEWAKIICEELGCIPIMFSKMGVNLEAQGLVRDQKPLKKCGFQFGEEPYKMTATRIDTRRYLITVQCMSRPEDHQEKEIALKTRADTAFPVNIAPAPEGKYTWNSAIQYDMEHQAGLRPHALLEEKPIGFVDVYFSHPYKIAALGFSREIKKDANYQLVYVGDNQWELNSSKEGRTAILAYEDSQWRIEKTEEPISTSDHPISTVTSSTPEPEAQDDTVASLLTHDIQTKAGIILFDRVETTEGIFNSKPTQFQVYTARQDGTPLYLVNIEKTGPHLVDPSKHMVYRADSAVLLPGGRQMMLAFDDILAITPSAVDVLTGDTKERIEASWGECRVGFTVTTSTTHTTQAKHEVQTPVPDDPRTKAAERPLPLGLLFPNSDFENGNLDNWTASGTAFDYQPTKGDNPTARKGRQPSNHQGDFWIGTYEKYQGVPGQQPGKTQGDKPTGTLTSIPFQLSEDCISFLIGGGRRLDSVYVALIVDGSEVLKATGNNNESMRRHTWDVTPYKGKEARIVISDQFSGGWGHINADDFRYDVED